MEVGNNCVLCFIRKDLYHMRLGCELELRQTNFLSKVYITEPGSGGNLTTSYGESVTPGGTGRMNFIVVVEGHGS